MRRFGKACTQLIVVALFAVACSGSSDGEVTSPATAVEATATEVPTDDPTPVPTEVPTPDTEPTLLSNDEKAAAAIAAFDADPQPGDLIAWDHLEANVRNSAVDVIVCAWDGETVFDTRRQATYRVIPGNDAPQVILESATRVPGDCLNSDLIESALQATRDHDTYWSGVLEDPTSFQAAVAAQILAPELIELNAPLVASWVADDVTWRDDSYDSALPESSDEAVLWRRYELGETELLEVIACRPQRDGFGLYRDGALLDDFQGDDPQGAQQIDVYQMRRDGQEWLLVGVEGFLWAACDGFPNGWFDGVNDWKSEPTSWNELPDG